MTPKELAETLNGREYGHEITHDEEIAAKASGLVVVFGYSDDNVELRGAINDEVGAYEGAEIPITRAGLLENECDDEDCPYFEKLRASAVTLEAIWDREGYSWVYDAPFPYETFEVMEDGEKYCRGIVFRLSDVSV